MPDSADFFCLLERSLQDGSFRKATLSRPGKTAPVGLRNIFLRPVELRVCSVPIGFRFGQRGLKFCACAHRCAMVFLVNR